MKTTKLLIIVMLSLLAACDADIGLRPALTAVATPPTASPAAIIATPPAASPTTALVTTPTTGTTATAAAPATPRPTNTMAPRPSATATRQAAPPSPTTAAGGVTPLPASPTPALNRRIAECAPGDDLPISQESLGDAYLPTLGNGGYDALHYRLELAVDLPNEALTGTTTLSALALQDLAEFNLDFQGMAIGQVDVNGAAARFRRSGGELAITPASPLRQGAEFTVSISYAGQPETGISGGAPVVGGWNFYGDGSYVASEPAGAQNWYPVNDHPCDKATYTFQVDVAQPYVVVANGLMRGVEERGDRRIYTWELRDPAPSYLVTVNVDEFVEQTEEGPGGLPIRNYFPRAIAAEMQDIFGRTGEMLELFNGQFGPYPFEAYGVVVPDTSLGFALETQTISLFGNTFGGGPGGEEVVAHELAHQWFGDSVSLKSWKDIWLKEGIATYSQWLWLEHLRGRAAVNERVRTMYGLVTDEAPPPPGAPPEGDLYNLGVYVRGGLTMQALRVEVGDDTFFNILRTYNERYRYSIAGTDDFIALAEELSGRQLDDLFQGWLFDEAMPPVEQLIFGG